MSPFAWIVEDAVSLSKRFSMNVVMFFLGVCVFKQEDTYFVEIPRLKDFYVTFLNRHKYYSLFY